MTRAVRRKSEQLSLFEAEAALMHAALSASKIDLHRHLTGSITAEMAVRVAASHNIELPTYLASELDTLLYPTNSVASHSEYFSPWPILNKLFSSLDSVRDLILEVARQAASDRVIYTELRLGPRGFLGDSAYSFHDFAQVVALATAEADKQFGTITRCILGIPRHIFIKIREETRNKMFAAIIRKVREFPDCFVGVDLNGDELAAPTEAFQVFFKLANEAGLPITVHAGEIAKDTHDIEVALESCHTRRIGHGIAAARSPQLLERLARQGIVLEICPTSNEFLGVIDAIGQLPLEQLQSAGVPFVICTDNPARCRTTMSEELYKVAMAFNYSPPEIRKITELALRSAFVSENLKVRIAEMIQPTGTS